MYGGVEGLGEEIGGVRVCGGLKDIGAGNSDEDRERGGQFWKMCRGNGQG